MSRVMRFLFVLTPMLAACQPVAAPSATNTPSRMASHSATATPTVVTLPTALAAETSTAGGQQPPDARVWYLGSNGWAVQIGEKLLVFDYQESYDPNPPQARSESSSEGTSTWTNCEPSTRTCS